MGLIDKLTLLVGDLDNLGRVLGNIDAAISSTKDANAHDLLVLLQALSDLLSGHPLTALGDLGKLSDLHRGAPGAAAQKVSDLPPASADLAKDLPRATPDQLRLMTEIRRRESHGNYAAVNQKDAAGNAAPQSRWHYGAWQFDDPTWRQAAAATGVGGQYPHASDAPPSVQDQAAYWLYLTRGTAPWAASGPYPNLAGAGPPSQSGKVVPLAPPLPRSSAVANIYDQVAMVRSDQQVAANANAVGGGSVDRSVTATFGNITVNTAATDGRGTAAAFSDAVRNRLLVAGANTGLA